MKTVLKKLMLFFLLLGITACGQNNNSSSQVDFSLIPVRTNYLWGYVNPKGEVVIPEIFADVNFFSDGLACVSDFNGNEGYIDKNGNYVITPKYTSATSFSEGLAFVTMEGEPIHCIDKTGKTIFVLDTVQTAEPFAEGLALIMVIDKDKKKKKGFVNKEGKVAIPLQYDELRPFSSGLAAFKEKDLWGFINTQGKVVVKPIYNEVTNFKDGKATVKVKNLSGVIDTQGKYVIGLRAGYIGNFNDGLAIFCAKGKPNSDVYPVGYIDEKGKIVIPIEYYDVSDFSSGLAAVRIKSAPYGLVYIDKKGKIVIKDDDFENTTSFYGDVAFVEKDDKWAMIDKKGKYIKEPTFKKVSDNFDKGIAFGSAYNATNFVAKFLDHSNDILFDKFTPKTTSDEVFKVWGRQNAGYTGSTSQSEPQHLSHPVVIAGIREITDDIYINKMNYYFSDWTILPDGTFKEPTDNNLLAMNYSFYLENAAGGKDYTVAQQLAKGLEKMYHINFAPTVTEITFSTTGRPKYDVEATAKQWYFRIYTSKTLRGGTYVNLLVGFDKGTVVERIGHRI